MEIGMVLEDGFTRIHEETHAVVAGLSAETMATQPTGQVNSIAWLVWHLTRIQDDHIADVAGTEQVWTAGGWDRRFALPFSPSATGYGQTADEVAQVRVGADDLLGYHDAVFAQTVAYVRTLTLDDLDRVVDESWDPPVTLGVRLVSVLADDLQHIGQAAYLKGWLADSH